MSALDPINSRKLGRPNVYVVSSFSGNLTINPVGTAATYVEIHVTGDITGSIDVKSNVHVKIYFDGNVSVKARDIVNESGIAGNLQFYGISPTDPAATQSIDIASPGNFSATFYAPSADFHINGQSRRHRCDCLQDILRERQRQLALRPRASYGRPSDRLPDRQLRRGHALGPAFPSTC